MELKDKRFLINQPMIGSFCGSTILTLELATYLKEKGAHVIIYTSYAGEPMASLFKKAHIEVITESDCPNFKLKDFDYIWVHSQILPYSIIEDLSLRHKSYPFFIFLHMSSLKKEIPDEMSWIYRLEKLLSSKTLYVGQESFNVNQTFLRLPKHRIGFYQNPVPDSFFQRTTPCHTKLKKILIVSNHPPKELLGAKKILQSQGYIVDSFGESQDYHTLISNHIISKYDAVITIGKTVRYCLVSGTPVYIYDRFGGKGWVTNENINYAGIDGQNKTESQISIEIINGYQKAMNYVTKKQSHFQNEYYIGNVLDRLLSGITKKSIKPLEETYKESIICAERLVQLRFILGELSSKEYQEKLFLLKTLHEKEKEISTLKSDIESITHAKSYRILKKLTSPLAKMRKLSGDK